MSETFREALVRELTESLESGEFVEIHRNPESPANFAVGVIQRIETRSVVFQNIDREGRFEDLPEELMLSKIFLVRRKTLYLRRLRCLFDGQVAERAALQVIDVRRRESRIQALTAAKATGQAVSIWIGGDRIEGLVLEVGTQHFRLREFATEGHEDGIGIYSHKIVERVRAGSFDETACNYLAQNPVPLGLNSRPS